MAAQTAWDPGSRRSRGLACGAAADYEEGALWEHLGQTSRRKESPPAPDVFRVPSAEEER